MPYTDRISKRLERFMNSKMVFMEVGDPENGPELDYQYNGPEWAIIMEILQVDGPEYFMWEIQFGNAEEC